MDEFDFFTNSRSKFNTYAGLDAPELPGAVWQDIQVRLTRWATSQFGTGSDLTDGLGIVEELGEFVEASIPSSQEEMEDAIGDTIIYTTQLCTGNRLDFHTLWEEAKNRQIDTKISTSDLVIAVAKLCHVILKTEQQIRGYCSKHEARQPLAYAIVKFLAVFHRFTSDAYRLRFGVKPDYEKIYVDTAERVLKRVWKQD